MSNFPSILENAVPGLRRIARALRRDLEALADRHAATNGLTPQLKSDELSRALADRQDQARGIIAGLSAQHNRAAELGDPIPSNYAEVAKEADALASRILAVSSLDAAYQLADTLRVAA